MSSKEGIFKKCYDFTEADEARDQGVYPFFKPIGKNAGTKVLIEGRELIMAGSNNYLGLAGDERVIEAGIKATREYGTSCSGSRFMNGTLTLHEEFESKLAEFTGKEDALCFTTGYQTNLGAISTMAGRGDHIITDKFNHASIMDGIFLTTGINKSVEVHRYRHNNFEDLEKILKSLPKEAAKLIITDGVFSMEGDIVDLPAMKKLADTYNAGIYLDEAHGIGVIGDTGRGTTEHFGNIDYADLIMCTFSKAFGSIGGFVAGDSKVIDYIKHFARPLIFSASMTPANVAAAMTSLEIIQKEPDRIHRLQEIGRKMVKGFSELGFNTGTSVTPIVPLIIGNNEKTFLFWKSLFERGVYVNPVISPGVPPNRAMIRTSYMATHTDEELNRILEISGEEGRKLGIID